MHRETLKEPKTFNYPRLYYQDVRGAKWSRIRILYPNGDCEYLMQSPFDFHVGFKFSCYGEPGLTGWQILKKMREYDSDHGWLPAEFLGEIR